MKLQNSVAPSIFSGSWLVTFYTPPQNSLDWQGLFSYVWCVWWSWLWLLELCLQDSVLSWALCNGQFTMSFIIPACYYKLTGYKNSSNILMGFFPTRDSVTHCHYSRVCSSQGVTAAAVLNKGATQTQRCNGSSHAVICHWWLISKTAHVVPEQHLIPFPPSFAELSCGVTCPASALILYSSALLPRLNRETQRQQKIVPKKAGFSWVFLSFWEIHLKDSRGDSRTQSEHTYTQSTLCILSILTNLSCCQ